MRRSVAVTLWLCCGTLAACSPGDGTGLTGTNAGLLVINADKFPVDVLLDESVASAAVDPGHVVLLTLSTGSHILALRQTGSAPMIATTFTTSARFQRAFAAVRTTGGTLAAATLDDTGSVVPAGATKLRVLHLAPNAGELQVYRTQPDFPTPVRWQFPFTYQAQPTSLSAPYYQSTVGTWEVRVWQSPADSTGWAAASVKVSVPLASGEKKTVVILDQPGGGVRVQLID
jgi:hypothetical protein